MKDERGNKITTKFETTAPKSYSYCVQKDVHETDKSEFIRANGVQKLVIRVKIF